MDGYSLNSSTVSLPAAIRADSPLLGFPFSQSDDPLLYPSPNYARDNPSDRDVAINYLIKDINSWQLLNKPLPLPPQPTPLPPSASPTRRSSRFPSIASAVALGLGSDHRKAVYITDDAIDSDLDMPLAPSSSPASTFTLLTTPALSPITSPAMSPTATSFSGPDDRISSHISRKPSTTSRPSSPIHLSLSRYRGTTFSATAHLFVSDPTDTPPSPSTSTFSHISHSSSPSNPNPPPLSPPLTPAQPPIDFDASRSRWSLTSSLLDAPSPPQSPQFTFPFASKDGRAHAKTKSSASSPENSSKDLSHPKRKPTKRARLVSFISRLGGVSPPATDVPTPLTILPADDIDIDSGSPPSSGHTLTHLALAFPSPPVGGGSAPTSPVSGTSATLWNGSVPSSPTSFSRVVSVPSSPSVPAFPRFDDPSAGRARGRASTLSVGAGLGLAAIIGGAKRRLVVSGIGRDDVCGYDAVRAWCEGFGEVRRIARRANGDLHVDFRKASVADTVCRVQAQVHIRGAGSVCLSWYTKR